MQVDYTVIFSPKRKRLQISVERDRSVVVRAPEGTDPKRIQQIVDSRKLWIYEKQRHPQKYQDRVHPPGKEMVNGESMLYLGQQYRIQLVDEGSDIKLEGNFFVPRSLIAKRGNIAFQDWYKTQAKKVIFPKVEQWAASLGVSYKKAKLSSSKYQWGSCTVHDNLNFNWRLIKAPMFVIEYVVVHELVHLIEDRHTSRFWRIVRTNVVQMEKAKRWLRENGALLEIEL